MKQEPPPYRSAPDAHLRYLVIIRGWVLAGLWIAIAFNSWLIQMKIAWLPLTSILILMTAVNLLTWLRLDKSLPVTDIELFIQLLIDVFCLSGIVFFVGGANNPFISYLLVPVCIAAATLNTRMTWLITALCLTGYSLLLFFYIEQPTVAPHHHHHSASPHQGINLHILGMWATFSVSAILISYFVNRMANSLRIQTRRLNQRHEDEWRDEQLMAVATLAAGTAHELGTPLSTMKVVLHELLADSQNKPLQEELQILSNQVEQCSGILRQLVVKADLQHQGEITPVNVKTFCLSIIDQWKLMRPEVSCQVAIDTTSVTGLEAVFAPTVQQAIINMLHNAADASPHNILINIQWNRQQMTWLIDDNGAGIPGEIQEELGKAFVTTKGKGLGIGFFITHATINRFGGQIRLFSRAAGGTRAELILPLTGVQHEY